MKSSIVCVASTQSKQDNIFFMSAKGLMSIGIQGGIQLLISLSS